MCQLTLILRWKDRSILYDKIKFGLKQDSSLDQIPSLDQHILRKKHRITTKNKAHMTMLVLFVKGTFY